MRIRPSISCFYAGGRCRTRTAPPNGSQPGRLQIFSPKQSLSPPLPRGWVTLALRPGRVRAARRQSDHQGKGKEHMHNLKAKWPLLLALALLLALGAGAGLLRWQANSPASLPPAAREANE